MPGTRSASSGRKLGRDFMRAYHSRAGGLTVQSTSPWKSSTDRCAAAAKSASESWLPASHVAGFRQPAQVVQVLAQVGVAGAQRGGVGMADAGDALEVFLAVEVAGDLVGELAVEPGEQATHLDPLAEGGAEQRMVRVGFLEVLADHAGVGDGEAAVLQQGRHRGGGVQGQVFGAPLPHLFHAQFERQPFFGQHEADLAAIGRERQVENDSH